MKKFKSASAGRFIAECQRIIEQGKARSFTKIAVLSGYISQDFTDIKSGKKDLQRDFLESVAEKFDIDKNFVLTGIPSSNINVTSSKSHKLEEIQTSSGLNTSDDINKNAGFYQALPLNNAHLNTKQPTINTSKGVPYYDIDFMGGFDLVFNSQEIQPLFYIDFLPFNDCDCWINVTGKSMGPLIAHGDIVGLKKVHDWQRFLLEGEIYAIITDNGFRTIKMIGAGPDSKHYTLIPYNKSEDYRPQIIPKDVITHIFRVKGNIKKFF